MIGHPLALVSLLTLVGLSLPLRITAGAEPTRDAQEVREAIRKAEDDRVARVKTIEVEWTTRARDSRLVLERADQHAGSPFAVVRDDPEKSRRHLEQVSRPLPWDKGFVEYEQSCRLLVAGRLIRTEVEGQAPHGTKSLLPWHYVTVGDGTVATRADLCRSLIRWPMVSIEADTVPRVAAFHDRGAFDWLRREERPPLPNVAGPAQVREELVPLPDEMHPDCVALRRTRGSVDSISVYDPAKDYALVLRITMSRQALPMGLPPGGKAPAPVRGEITVIRRREEFSHARHVESGLWLPASWTVTQFVGLRETLWTKTSTVRRLTINSEIPPERFRFTPPAGAIVSDGRPDASGRERGGRLVNTLVRLDGGRRIIRPEDQLKTYEDLISAE